MTCKDCEPGTKRPAPHPGPRCATHHRAFRASRRELAWGLYLKKTYNITPEQYWALYEAQGGLCALCRRASGKTKKLAVDHDHACCPGPTSCGRCVRGLLCSADNKILGHARDERLFFMRAWLYLTDPPWRVLRAKAEAQHPDPQDP